MINIDYRAPLARDPQVANTSCPHLGLRASVGGKVIYDFINLSICFFSYRDRDSVPINNR